MPGDVISFPLFPWRWQHRPLKIKHRLLVDVDESLMRMREIEDEHDDHADEQRKEDIGEAGTHTLRP